MMKKNYSLFLLLFSFLVINAQDAGIFESYAILNINGAGNTYYDMQATTSNIDFNGANLGTFTNAESIVVAGGENKTWKSGGADVTANKLNYRIYTGTPSGTYSTVNYPWIQDLGGGDQKWGCSTGTTNILAGLAPGNYVLEVYSDADTSVGTKYSSNGGANYKASFTVSSTLATSNINSQNFKSFVNNGKLYTSKKGLVAIQVMDYSGRIVKSFNAKSSTEGIDLFLTKKGFYILKIGNETIKFQN